MNKKKIMTLIIAFCLLLIAIILVITSLKRENVNYQEETEQEIGPIIQKEHYECNEFEYCNISTEQLLQAYINEYKYTCINEPELAYERLDKEYKKEKFKTLDSYIQYINENRSKIIGAQLGKFEINNYGDYKEYIIQDQFKNYYVFHVTAIMEYTVCLDTYTIPTSSFAEKYNKASNEKKAGMNLNRFLEAVNNNDYQYAYNKLPTAFKNNYFQTLQDFENYINQNWLEYDNIKTVKTENQSGVYVCNLKVLDADNKYIEKTFMIQIGENTEYMVSFTV